MDKGNMRITVTVAVVTVLLLALSVGIYTVHGVPSTPTLENHGTACYTSASSFTTSITSSPNALIILIVQLNMVTPTGVSDSSNLVWHGPVAGFAANGVSSLYWAAKTSGGPIVVNTTLPDVEHFKVLWFDVLNANLTSPFDPNTSLPAASGPQGGPTMTLKASTSHASDFIFAYVTQVSGATPTNTPVANSPFSILDGNNVGCYSQATWLANFVATAKQSNVVFSPLTFVLSNQVSGSIMAIQGTGSATTTTTTSSTTTTTTTTTTTSTTTTTTTSTTTTISTTTSVQTLLTSTLSGSKVTGFRGTC